MPAALTHTANRLTSADRADINERMADSAARWTGAGLTRWLSTDHAALVRVGLRSIGCTTADMRDSELDEVAAMATTLVLAVGATIEADA